MRQHSFCDCGCYIILMREILRLPLNLAEGMTVIHTQCLTMTWAELFVLIILLDEICPHQKSSSFPQNVFLPCLGGSES